MSGPDGTGVPSDGGSPGPGPPVGAGDDTTPPGDPAAHTARTGGTAATGGTARTGDGGTLVEVGGRVVDLDRIGAGDRGVSAGRMVARLAVAVLAVVVLGAGGGGLWVQRHLDPPGPPGQEVVVEIPQGSSVVQIGELLEDRGVITSATVWRWYVRLRGVDRLNAGRFRLRERMAMGDVVEVLRGEPEITYETITVREGLWLAEILPAIAGQSERLEVADLEAALASGAVRSSLRPEGVGSWEGLLFPDTYRFDETEDAADLLARMAALMERHTTELGYAEAPQRVGLSPYETLIVASLVEAEARVPEDRPKIARVIYNRLALGMPLQVDATVIYALGDRDPDTPGVQRTTRVLFSDLELDSPYNTYRVTGLPPTPIAAPGRASLEAAIRPAEGPWLYYVVIDSTGRHAFAETLEEHNANIREAERNGVR